MLAYLSLFVVTTIGVLSPIKFSGIAKHFGHYIFLAFAIFLIGFRDEVGGDWKAYLNYYEITIETDILDILFVNDPGYMFLNWLSSRFSGGILGVNLAIGTILLIGLYNFSKHLTYPWLAYLIAVPNLITIIGMGYSRQAIAVGIILLAISTKGENSKKTLILLLISSLFHKFALVFFLFYYFIIFDVGTRQKLIFGLFLGTFVVGIVYVQSGLILEVIQNYILYPKVNSAGALPRYILNLLPSLIFVFYRQYFKNFLYYRVYLLSSVFFIISLPILFYFSTALDRMSIYFIALQLGLYSDFLDKIAIKFQRTLVMVGLVMVYLFTYLIWLNYANNAKFWVPYHWKV